MSQQNETPGKDTPDDKYPYLEGLEKLSAQWGDSTCGLSKEKYIYDVLMADVAHLQNELKEAEDYRRNEGVKHWDQVLKLKAERDSIRAEVERLRGALTGLFNLIEDGTLVRNISSDTDPAWAIKQLPLIRALAVAKEALNPTK